MLRNFDDMYSKDEVNSGQYTPESQIDAPWTEHGQKERSTRTGDAARSATPSDGSKERMDVADQGMNYDLCNGPDDRGTQPTQKSFYCNIENEVQDVHWAAEKYGEEASTDSESGENDGRGHGQRTTNRGDNGVCRSGSEEEKRSEQDVDSVIEITRPRRDRSGNGCDSNGEGSGKEIGAQSNSQDLSENENRQGSNQEKQKENVESTAIQIGKPRHEKKSS